MPQFQRYLGIDYSGAETPTKSLKGLRLYAATPTEPPVEIPPPPSPRKYWTRRGLAEWLAAELRTGPSTLVGIDHAFSFPMRYFEVHHLHPDWPAFLDDFHHHWPTDEDCVYVDFVRNGSCGQASARMGDRRWRRLTEMRCGSAKSVYHFDVEGSVAKSTHSGLPWLRYLRQQLGDRVHFWPFDGWTPPVGRSVIAEVYPALWKRSYPPEDRNVHQHDAYSVASWMKEADASGQLAESFTPILSPNEQTAARVEGWILGTPTSGQDSIRPDRVGQVSPPNPAMPPRDAQPNHERRELILRKIGRNVINFQKVEAVLKALVVGSRVAGTTKTIAANQAKRSKAIGSRPLGMVAEMYHKTVLAKPKDEDEPEDLKSVYLSMSFSIDLPPDLLAKRKKELAGLVKERNKLIHGGLSNIDWDCHRTCLDLIEALDAQNERISNVLAELRHDCASLANCGEIIRDLWSNDDFRNEFLQGGQDPRESRWNKVELPF